MEYSALAHLEEKVEVIQVLKIILDRMSMWELKFILMILVTMIILFFMERKMQTMDNQAYLYMTSKA